jgi:hypothetical protein
MYGYLVSFILIFLTHPGVAYNFFDPGVAGGIAQAAIVLFLSSPSTGKASLANTMAIIYYVMLGIWAYVKVRLALAS